MIPECAVRSAAVEEADREASVGLDILIGRPKCTHTPLFGALFLAIAIDEKHCLGQYP
jgi:hypothetical protein